MLPSVNESFILNPLITYGEFDGAGKKSYLIEVPDEEGNTNKFIIPIWLFELIQIFTKEITLEEAINSYSQAEEHGRPDRESFLSLITSYLIPNKIIIELNETNLLAKKSKTRTSYLNLKLPLIKPNYIRPVSALFSFLHNKLWSISLLIICFSTILSFLMSNYSYSSQSFLTTTDTLYLLLILAGGLFFHELGHASAAYKYGCRNVEIGVGWYMIFIIFYADLTETWRLSRRKRVVIDIGGMYFQTIFIAILCAINVYYPSLTLQVAIYALLISLLLNLNPFFRMDGFWLASDLLGVPNLKQVSKNLTINFFLGIFGIRPHTTIPLELPKKKMNYLKIYIVLSNIALLAICYIFTDILINSVTFDLPNLINSLQLHIYLELDLTDRVFTLLKILWLVILSIFIVYYLGKKAWRLLSFFLKVYNVKTIKKVH